MRVQEEVLKAGPSLQEQESCQMYLFHTGTLGMILCGAKTPSLGRQEAKVALSHLCALLILSCFGSQTAHLGEFRKHKPKYLSAAVPCSNIWYGPIPSRLPDMPPMLEIVEVAWSVSTTGKFFSHWIQSFYSSFMLPPQCKEAVVVRTILLTVLVRLWKLCGFVLTYIELKLAQLHQTSLELLLIYASVSLEEIDEALCQ